MFQTKFLKFFFILYHPLNVEICWLEPANFTFELGFNIIWIQYFLMDIFYVDNISCQTFLKNWFSKSLKYFPEKVYFVEMLVKNSWNLNFLLLDFYQCPVYFSCKSFLLPPLSPSPLSRFAFGTWFLCKCCSLIGTRRLYFTFASTLF